jgi:hypothetical protein
MIFVKSITFNTHARRPFSNSRKVHRRKFIFYITEKKRWKYYICHLKISFQVDYVLGICETFNNNKDRLMIYRFADCGR